MILYKGDSVTPLYNLLYLWQEREAALPLYLEFMQMHSLQISAHFN